MMTWVSLRSGMASSGMVRIDQIPAATAKPNSANTTNLLCPENSMIRSIMAVPSRSSGYSALEFRFRIHQERAGRNNTFPHAQALQDLYAITEAFADLYRTRFQ